jgi:hypothetical protein
MNTADERAGRTLSVFQLSNPASVAQHKAESPQVYRFLVRLYWHRMRRELMNFLHRDSWTISFLAEEAKTPESLHPAMKNIAEIVNLEGLRN